MTITIIVFVAVVVAKDRNDNRPVINSGDTTFSVCENRRLGANLGKMYCHDEDSSFQGNNVTYFT